MAKTIRKPRSKDRESYVLRCMARERITRREHERESFIYLSKKGRA